MTQYQLIALFALDLFIGASLLLLVAFGRDYVRNWNPSGKWGLAAEGVKIVILGVGLGLVIIIMAEIYNFWMGV